MNKKDSMRYVYPLCFGEEVGNCITHGVMALLIRQFDSCKIIIIPNVAYVALFLCQIFFLFCCMDVVRRCNV